MATENYFISINTPVKPKVWIKVSDIADTIDILQPTVWKPGEEPPAPPSNVLRPLLLYTFENQEDQSQFFVDLMGHSASNTSSGFGVNATKLDATKQLFGNPTLKLRPGTQLQLGRQGTIRGQETEFDFSSASFRYDFSLYISSTNTPTYVEAGWWGNISNRPFWAFRCLWLSGATSFQIEVFDAFMNIGFATLFDEFMHCTLHFDAVAELATFIINGNIVATASTVGAEYFAYDIFEPCLILEGADGDAWMGNIRVLKNENATLDDYAIPSSSFGFPIDAQAPASTLNGGLTALQLSGAPTVSGSDNVDDTGKIITLEVYQSVPTPPFLSFITTDAPPLAGSGGCIEFTDPGTSQSLVAPHLQFQAGPDLDLLNSDWEFDIFFKRSTSNYTAQVKFPGANTGPRPSFVSLILSSGGSIQLDPGIGTSNYYLDLEQSTAALGVWHHIKIAKIGTTLNAGVNGLGAGSMVAPAAFASKPLNWASLAVEFFGSANDEHLRLGGIRMRKGAAATYAGGAYSVPTAY